MGDHISPATKMINTARASWSAITRNLVSKTYLKGLADFMEVITDDSSMSAKGDYYLKQN